MRCAPAYALAGFVVKPIGGIIDIHAPQVGKARGLWKELAQQTEVAPFV